MPFDLAFHPAALREWLTLTAEFQEQFKNKFAEQVAEPRIPACKLQGSTNRIMIEVLTHGQRQPPRAGSVVPRERPTHALL